MTTPAITIRLAEPSHFDAIANLTASVYIGEDFSPAMSETALRDVATRAAATTLLVAVDEPGVVLGAVSLVYPGSPFRQVGLDTELETRLLAVSPASRGLGIGETLMHEALAVARRDSLGVVLSTQPTMQAAHRLYQRLGFTRTPSRDWLNPAGREMQVYTHP